jgi:hypothetical protein
MSRRETGPRRLTRAGGWRRCPRVGGQRRLLESLIAAAEAAPAFRWLELGGSLARGAGDELSDIDAGLGIADASWDEDLAAAETATRAAGPVADAFRQRYPGKDGQPCWHSVHALPDRIAAQPGGHARLVARRAANKVLSSCHPDHRAPRPALSGASAGKAR